MVFFLPRPDPGSHLISLKLRASRSLLSVLSFPLFIAVSLAAGCCISPGQSYACRGSTGVSRQYFGAPDRLEQRFNGLGKYEPSQTFAPWPDWGRMTCTSHGHLCRKGLMACAFSSSSHDSLISGSVIRKGSWQSRQ